MPNSKETRSEIGTMTGPVVLTDRQREAFDNLFMAMRPGDECEWRMSKPVEAIVAAACVWAIAREKLHGAGVFDLKSLFHIDLDESKAGGEASYESAIKSLVDAVHAYSEQANKVGSAKIDATSEEGRSEDAAERKS